MNLAGKTQEFDFVKETEGVKGWLTPSEGNFLYERAKQIRGLNKIIEIGSWKGKSTICLARGSEKGHGASVYAIDPHMSSLHGLFHQANTYEEFIFNIKKAGLMNYVIPMISSSPKPARVFNKEVGLLFIDGSHDLKSVRADYNAWFDKVVDGGTIAFHDSWRFMGPSITSARALLTSPHVRNPKLVDTITAFDKVEQNTPIDRLVNATFLLYRTLVGYKGSRKLSSRAEM